MLDYLSGVLSKLPMLQRFLLAARMTDVNKYTAYMAAHSLHGLDL